MAIGKAFVVEPFAVFGYLLAESATVQFLRTDDHFITSFADVTKGLEYSQCLAACVGNPAKTTNAREVIVIDIFNSINTRAFE